MRPDNDYADINELANACFVEAEDAVALAKELGFEDDEIQVGKDGSVIASVSWYNKQAVFKASPQGVAMAQITATMPGLSGLRDASDDAVTLKFMSDEFLRSRGVPNTPKGSYIVAHMEQGDQDMGFAPDYDIANAAVVNFFYKVSDLRDKRKAAFAMGRKKPSTPRP